MMRTLRTNIWSKTSANFSALTKQSNQSASRTLSRTLPTSVSPFAFHRLPTRFISSYSGQRSYSTFVGLPFTISRKDANGIFSNNKHFFEESKLMTEEKKDLTIFDPNNTIKECFVPFHSAAISNVRSSYTGKFGIDRTEWYWTIEYNAALKMSLPAYRSRTVTDWWTTTGTTRPNDYPLGTSETQVYAGFKYPRRHIESVLIKDSITKIEPLTDSMLIDQDKKRRIVYPHDMNISFAIEKMMNKLYSIEKDRAINHMLRQHGADHAEVEDLSIHLETADIKLKSYHLPVYVYSFVQDGIVLNKFVDGYTGRYDGDYVLSPMKMFFVGSLIGIGAAPFFAAAPGLGVAAMIVRMALGGMLTGIPVSLFGKYRHVYKRDSDRISTDADNVHNKTFQETDDDLKRRVDAEQFNSGHSSTDSTGSRSNTYNDDDRYRYMHVDSIIEEKLTLLGLNPKTLPTESVLKAHYYQMVKKWHPDTYQGDKTLANKMTLQINDAYQTILKIIKEHK